MSAALDRTSMRSSEEEGQSRAILDGLAANELIFAVVGPVGSGTSEIAGALRELLEKNCYDATILKARSIIEEGAKKRNEQIQEKTKIDWSIALQDAGDLLRKESNDNAAIAIGLVDLFE